MEATSKWHKFLELPKWSPEIVPARLLELWTAITPDYRVWSKRGLNQSCSPRRDLFNAMSHSQIGCREKVDSRLLVVGSQTANLTPGPSFAHNLGYRYPNGNARPFSISTFQDLSNDTKNTQCEVFWTLLSSSKHLGVPEDSKSPTFPSVGLHPYTWPKWGCNTHT
jgi:hypothetical protein